jgi:hypothetical protein
VLHIDDIGLSSQRTSKNLHFLMDMLAWMITCISNIIWCASFWISWYERVLVCKENTPITNAQSHNSEDSNFNIIINNYQMINSHIINFISDFQHLQATLTMIKETYILRKTLCFIRTMSVEVSIRTSIFLWPLSASLTFDIVTWFMCATLCLKSDILC